MRSLLTTRALRSLLTHSLAAFGLLALGLQFYQAVWDSAPFPRHEVALVSAVAAASVGYGLLRTLPRGSVSRHFRQPDFRVEIKPGDLFDERDAHLVIGFTDVFDTDTTDDRIIHRSSVQAQFLRREYGGDRARLDADLDTALAGRAPAGTVERSDKRYGKLCRYPVGTVAVLGLPQRYFFCVAYSTMTNHLTAQSSGDLIWHSLAQLWEEIFRHGQRTRVAMSVIGAALARVDSLDRAGLIKLIVLSFVATSRKAVLTNTLTIVVRPEEFTELDRLELQAFLNSI